MIRFLARLFRLPRRRLGRQYRIRWDKINALVAETWDRVERDNSMLKLLRETRRRELARWEHDA